PPTAWALSHFLSPREPSFAVTVSPRRHSSMRRGAGLLPEPKVRWFLTGERPSSRSSCIRRGVTRRQGRQERREKRTLLSSCKFLSVRVNRASARGSARTLAAPAGRRRHTGLAHSRER